MYGFIEKLTLKTADGSSYNPAIMATWPGRDSVGTLVLDNPHFPLVLADLYKKLSIDNFKFSLYSTKSNRT